MSGAASSVQCWSTAGLGTTVLYTGLGKRRALLFDIGRFGRDEIAGGVINADDVFISHGHSDHCAAAFLFARSRAMQAKGRTRFFMPRAAVEDFTKAGLAMHAIDVGSEKNVSKPGADMPPIDIVGVSPGEMIDLGRGTKVAVLATEHRVPSVGYAVIQTHKKLRPALAELSAAEKSARFKASPPTPDDYEIQEVVDFAYTGDTVAQALTRGAPSLFARAKILCMEVTFFDGEVSRAAERGHIHIDEVAALGEQGFFDDVDSLVLMHFSARYGPAFVADTLLKKMPVHLHPKLRPAFDMALVDADAVWTLAKSKIADSPAE